MHATKNIENHHAAFHKCFTQSICYFCRLYRLDRFWSVTETWIAVEFESRDKSCSIGKKASGQNPKCATVGTCILLSSNKAPSLCLTSPHYILLIINRYTFLCLHYRVPHFVYLCGLGRDSSRILGILVTLVEGVSYLTWAFNCCLSLSWFYSAVMWYQNSGKKKLSRLFLYLLMYKNFVF